MTRKRRHGWLGLVLICLAGSVQALGLGNIEVKSGLNQPFLAEIPLVGAGPDEVDTLEVGLASAEAFAQVGLDAPTGVAANLLFAVVAGADGQSRILISTKGRVNDPFLTFVLDVQWQGGRLLREFSVLIDPPYLAPAVHKSVTPAIAAAPPERPPAPMPRPAPEPAATLGSEPVAAIAEPEPASPEPLTDTQPAGPGAGTSAESAAVEPPPAMAVEPDVAPTPEPAPVKERVAPPAPPPPTSSMAASAAPVSDGSIYGPVQSGQTLSQIASATRPPQASINQMMVAILRSNERAFIDGNINLLKRGEVLRMPTEQEVLSLGAAEVNALVQAQTEAWLGRRQAAAPAIAPEPDSGIAVEAGPPATRPVAAVSEGARLKILASDEESQTSAAQSGIDSAGAGATLGRSDETDEAMRVASQARIEELQARLEQLEKIRADSERLLILRERELAEIQARVSQLEQVGGSLGTDWYNRPWVFAGLAVLISGLIALLLIVRRERDAYRLQAHAASVGSPTAGWTGLRNFPADENISQGDAGPSRAQVVPADPDVDHEVEASADWNDNGSEPGLESHSEAGHEPEPVFEPESMPEPEFGLDPGFESEPGFEPEPGFGPEIEAGLGPVSAPEPEPHASPALARSASPESGVEAVAGSDFAAGLAPSPRHAPEHPGGQPTTIKLELARAYLDIGDARGARALLEEVLSEGDPRFRADAREMLDELD